MDELERIKKEKLDRFVKKMEDEKMQTEIEVNDNNFQEKVIEQSKKVLVVVDFWAQWCTPCLMLGPILENLAKEYNGKFVLAKINISENPIIGRKYMIMSIPCVKLFKNGKVADEFVGALPEESVRLWLNKNI